MQSDSVITKDIKTNEGYVLAPFFSRFAAATLDLAINLILIIFTYIVSFSTLGNKLGIYDLQNNLYDYLESAGLMSQVEGQYQYINSSNYEDYFEACQTYYLVYNGQDSVNQYSHNYTIADDFNPRVLGLPKDVSQVNTSKFYEFDKTNNEIDQNKIGVLKESCFDSNGLLKNDIEIELLSYFQDKFTECYEELFNEEYYSVIYNEMTSKTRILLVISTIVPTLFIYVVIPLLNQNGATFAKKLLKLRLYNLTGGDLPKWKIAARSSLLIVTLLVAIFIDDIVASTSIGIIIFFVSMTVALLSKRRQALHDLIVLSVVGKQNE